MQALNRTTAITPASVSEALNSDRFWLKPHSDDYYIIKEAVAQGYVFIVGETDAHWTKAGLAWYTIDRRIKRLQEKIAGWKDANSRIRGVIYTAKANDNPMLTLQYHREHSFNNDAIGLHMGQLKLLIESMPKQNTITLPAYEVKDDVAAITAFREDKRFSITE